MAFDSKVHEFSPTSGFIVDKQTGHPVGLVANPTLGAIPNRGARYPTWVTPHDSYVVRYEGKPAVTPLLGDCHVDRNTGVVTVLVRDEDDEKRAMSEAPKEEDRAAAAQRAEEARRNDDHNPTAPHEPMFAFAPEKFTFAPQDYGVPPGDGRTPTPPVLAKENADAADKAERDQMAKDRDARIKAAAADNIKRDADAADKLARDEADRKARIAAVDAAPTKLN